MSGKLETVLHVRLQSAEGSHFTVYGCVKEQVHFNGHDDDIRALDIHPDKIRVVTGQMGKEPKILVWSSKPERCVIVSRSLHATTA